MFIYQDNVFIRYILDLFFRIFSFILAKAILLQFLDLLDGFATDIADGDPGLLAFTTLQIPHFESDGMTAELSSTDHRNGSSSAPEIDVALSLVAGCGP